MECTFAKCRISKAARGCKCQGVSNVHAYSDTYKVSEFCSSTFFRPVQVRRARMGVRGFGGFVPVTAEFSQGPYVEMARTPPPSRVPSPAAPGLPRHEECRADLASLPF